MVEKVAKLMIVPQAEVRYRFLLLNRTRRYVKLNEAVSLITPIKIAEK